ncbi:hypothetical protein [Streptomonospora salina]|uniref:Uncharacterized protein n=1 Tax=Streptomonospora salina TaxID=104205 RepID=A0A841EA07_9ACTN|nr:hypothetical protein [Streptomonospora salina]MBB5999294.1 hypothetical protein [Streptomonospora salina]
MISDYDGDTLHTRAGFDSATADGVEFFVRFAWNAAEPTGEIFHSQLYAESGGERYTTGEEGVMTSYATAQGGSETVIEPPFVLRGAPESGAVFFQGPDYGTDGTGMPPLGVCCAAGGAFTTEGCS